MNSKQKIIATGAEATIFLEENIITKKRNKKSYRIPQLDEKIRKLRTKSETKLLKKASEIIPIPKIINSNEKTKEIQMEFIKGEKLSEHLDKFPLKKQKEILKQIGKNIAILHKENLIHGDLTTSNMILKNQKSDVKERMSDVGGQMSKKGCRKSDVGNQNSDIKERMSDIGPTGMTHRLKLGLNQKSEIELYLIDFGLGFHNGKYEDKAVDIHLLKQALEAKHFKNWEILFKEFEKAYLSINKKEAEKVFQRLKAVEKRGRYKH